MTCIIGYIDKVERKMYMLGDSAGVYDYEITIRKDKKVFKRNIKISNEEIIEVLIGFTSSFRMGQILMFCDLPEMPKSIDEFEYLVKIFVPHLMHIFKDQNYLQSYQGDWNEQAKGGTFLIAINGRLFCIEDDFQIREVYQCYDSIGCGEFYAITALQVMSDIENNMTVEQKILKAAKIAAFNNAGVREPFNIVMTDY